MFDDLGVIIRTLVMLLSLLLVTRILGRRTLSELTFYDFVIGLVIGHIGGSVITNEEFSIRNGLVALAVSVIWILAINMLTLNFVPARKLIEAEPLLVIYRGKILENNLKKRYYNVNDLLEMLREQGTFDPAQVEIALIESDGQLSVLKKPEYQTPSIKDFAIQKPHQTPAGVLAGTEIIIDGEIIEHGLALSGLTLEQLKIQLSNLGVSNWQEVTLAMITPDGKLYLDKRDDTL
ncbi:MAG: DUF421 domain-containing protein [Veillonellaceae bacterium]|nr:DUF421 domain-containing protein [Veillonellaceae bacterium]